MYYLCTLVCFLCSCEWLPLGLLMLAVPLGPLFALKYNYYRYTVVFNIIENAYAANTRNIFIPPKLHSPESIDTPWLMLKPNPWTVLLEGSYLQRKRVGEIWSKIKTNIHISSKLHSSGPNIEGGTSTKPTINSLHTQHTQNPCLAIHCKHGCWICIPLKDSI